MNVQRCGNISFGAKHDNAQQQRNRANQIKQNELAARSAQTARELKQAAKKAAREARTINRYV